MSRVIRFRRQLVVSMYVLMGTALIGGGIALVRYKTGDTVFALAVAGVTSAVLIVAVFIKELG
jgi:hypothetical protein